MTYMQTHNGHRFEMSVDDLAGNRIDADDIATSLAKQCRFNGHVPGFYSVAEHSVLVSRLVPPGLALHGLLHDVAEAYVGDIISPVKMFCPWVPYAEARIYQHICHSLGLDDLLYTTGSDQRRIKEADLTALAVEFDHFFGSVPDDLAGWLTDVPARKRPQGLDWQDARLLFINRFNQLTTSEATA